MKRSFDNIFNLDNDKKLCQFVEKKCNTNPNIYPKPQELEPLMQIKKTKKNIISCPVAQNHSLCFDNEPNSDICKANVQNSTAITIFTESNNNSWCKSFDMKDVIIDDEKINNSDSSKSIIMLNSKTNLNPSSPICANNKKKKCLFM